MKFSAERITELIAECNSSSTADAVNDYNEKRPSGGKAAAVFKLKFSFLKTFIQNRERMCFRDRLVYSVVTSFRVFLKDLKLLKLNNKI